MINGIWNKSSLNQYISDRKISTFTEPTIYETDNIKFSYYLRPGC